MQTTTRYLLTI